MINSEKYVQWAFSVLLLLLPVEGFLNVISRWITLLQTMINNQQKITHYLLRKALGFFLLFNNTTFYFYIKKENISNIVFWPRYWAWPLLLFNNTTFFFYIKKVYISNIVFWPRYWAWPAKNQIVQKLALAQILSMGMYMLKVVNPLAGPDIEHHPIIIKIFFFLVVSGYLLSQS